MLDSDLAKLCECKNKTKSINLAVKRNTERFPNDFYFQLTEDEYRNILRFQSETLELKQGKYSKYLPYAFTEQGVAMLATVIHTTVATKVSINIMRAFVTMRHLIINNHDIYKSINYINNKLLEHDEKFNYLFSKFDKKEQLFLKGQTFSAYSNILEILNSAKESILVIYEYADISFLNLINAIKCNIILITKDSNRLSDIVIEKYMQEYHNLKVIRNNSFHDRFIIVDNKDIYLLGSSINNAGDKTFMIIKLENDSVKKTIINEINKINNKKIS